ncbi:hypothetical protein, partial [Enterobacter hormaechei]|uniref:hypothetical protein n=1 Tax=Enterobacter hormaechei TaxID=158836 RepID=UPI0019538284
MTKMVVRQLLAKNKSANAADLFTVLILRPPDKKYASQMGRLHTRSPIYSQVQKKLSAQSS